MHNLLADSQFLIFGPDQEKCGGLEVVLNAGNNFLTYNWSTGDIGVKTIVVDSTGYWVWYKKDLVPGSLIIMEHNQIQFISHLKIVQESMTIITFFQI